VVKFIDVFICLANHYVILGGGGTIPENNTFLPDSKKWVFPDLRTLLVEDFFQNNNLPTG